MGATYEVRIDGRAIPLADHQWTLSMGIAAPIQAWEAPRELVEEIVAAKAGKEVTLQLDAIKVERVVVLGNGAHASDPQRQFLLLTDVRWYWTRAWFAMNVNLRRRVGDKRLVGAGPLEARPSVQDVQFARFSINELDPWRWDTLLQSVMRTATTARRGRPTIQWVLDDAATSLEAKTIEETITDAEMPVGIARAVGATPGRDLYVDLKGVVHVCDKTPGSERPLVDPFVGHEVWNHGSMAWCSLAAQRAKRSWVKFTREHDVRLAKGLATVSATDPYLENVLPVPDAELFIPASQARNRGARTVGRGTWITFDEAYEAWGSPGRDIPRLSDDIVRTAYTGNWLQFNYVELSQTPEDLVWQRRIDAVMEHYRRTFRVNPKFWGQVLSARAVTSAIWDEETGTRAPSPVISDYAIKPTVRSLAANTFAASNVVGNVTTSGSLADAKRAPANLVILDQEQGIVQAVWTPGPNVGAIAPSALEDVPDLDPASDPFVRAKSWATRKLVPESQYVFATIMALVPASPNSADRFYEVEVTLEEALAALGITGPAPDARGPDHELRSEIATARFAWLDDQDTRDRVLAIFRGEETSVSATDGTLTPQSLVPINRELELVPVARAVAAAELFQRLDHYEGQLAVPLDAGAAPIGAVTKVTHRVLAKAAHTIIEATSPRELPNVFDLLATSVRKRLGREVQP